MAVRQKHQRRHPTQSRDVRDEAQDQPPFPFQLLRMPLWAWLFFLACTDRIEKAANGDGNFCLVFQWLNPKAQIHFLANPTKATLRLFRCFADAQQELFRLLAAEDEFQWLFANSLHFKSQGQGQRRRLDKYRVTDRRTH
jgi:hypothetical protein